MPERRNGIIGGRYGYVGETKCFFTHRDPATGNVWTDDIHSGAWVFADKVKWCD